MEALQLLLLPRVLPAMAPVLRLLQACAVRAVLATAVFACNCSAPGMHPSCHANTAMSAAFAVVYVALYWAFRNHSGAAPVSGQGSKVD